MIIGVEMLIGILFIPFVAIPPLESIIFLFISAGIHTIYNLSLVWAYHKGDYSLVYPIARGMAPLLVTIFSLFILQEKLSFFQILGIILISTTISSSALMFFQTPGVEQRQATIRACFVGITIACYSIIDSIGVQHMGDAMGFLVYVSILRGFFFVGFIILPVFKKEDLKVMKKHIYKGVFGGVFAFASYGILVWVLSMGVLAPAIALRGTSVLFATIIGILFLKEYFALHRVFMGVIVCIGIILISTPH